MDCVKSSHFEVALPRPLTERRRFKRSFSLELKRWMGELATQLCGRSELLDSRRLEVRIFQ
jgi:hypothetical protein